MPSPLYCIVTSSSRLPPAQCHFTAREGQIEQQAGPRSHREATPGREAGSFETLRAAFGPHSAALARGHKIPACGGT